MAVATPVQIVATRDTSDRRTDVYVESLRVAFEGSAAREIGMPVARLNVMVGVAKLERITKNDVDLLPLVAAARALVSPHTLPAPRAPDSTATAGAML